MTKASLISLQEITRDLGDRKLFSELSLVLYENDRVVLIGPNGAGKSTLLKILSGYETADEGEVHLRSGTKISYVPQLETFEGNVTVQEVLEKGLVSDGIDHQDVLRRSSMWLGRCGFEDFAQPVSELSGGWRKRLSLACGFASEPDLLLLDEPTNHLDIESIEWLEKQVAGFRGAIVTVSHDRWFIEQVAKRVVELHPRYPSGTFASDGSYSDFLESRALYLESLQQMKDSLTNKVRREVAWLRAGVKARTTKSKSRIKRAHDMIDTLGGINLDQRRANLSFGSSERKTKELIKLESVGYSIGEKTLFSSLSLCISPGDKIGVVGANGSGKTSLLSVLLGKNQPTTGKIKIAKGLSVGFFDQARNGLGAGITLKEALAPDSDSIVVRGKPVHVAAWADRFLFSHSHLSLPIESLSGGEQARALLAILMAKEIDVLVFDEPTNDLDIQTLEVLEDACETFPGAVVLVTHDRYMLTRVATGVIGLSDGKATLCADYAQWEDAKRESKDKTRTGQARTESKLPPTGKKKTKLSYMEQRELDGMEQSILKAEESLAVISSELENPENVTNAEKLGKLSESYDAAKKAVDDLYKRWDELEDLKKQLDK